MTAGAGRLVAATHHGHSSPHATDLGLVLLFLAFGSVLLPLKGIVMNLLSPTASFGALVSLLIDLRRRSCKPASSHHDPY